MAHHVAHHLKNRMAHPISGDDPMTEHQLPDRNFAITLACIFATRVYTRSPD
jgi:hypothetical protein